MRPIAHARDVAMFHRVDVHVIDVVGEVAFIANGVLPITALPDASFAFAAPTVGNTLTLRQGARES